MTIRRTHRTDDWDTSTPSSAWIGTFADRKGQYHPDGECYLIDLVTDIGTNLSSLFGAESTMTKHQISILLIADVMECLVSVMRNKTLP